MFNREHKEALIEDHNREYDEMTAEQEEIICRRVIELIQDEVKPETLQGWRDTNRCIQNRVKRTLGLQSKYRADGTLRS